MNHNRLWENTTHWHNRFLQQARWTAQVRSHLFESLHLSSARRLLEVGCGTGVITADYQQRSGQKVYGVDIAVDLLYKAHNMSPECKYTCGDAFALPYSARSFDACFCHFLLLWLPDPVAALKEMKRILHTGAPVLVLAEPDYPARIDYPPGLTLLGEQQTFALEEQGANPSIGRSVAYLLHEAGFENIGSGLMGGQWGNPDSRQVESEAQTLRIDLAGRLSDTKINDLLEADRKAWQAGYRILFVPTFYAWGFTP